MWYNIVIIVKIKYGNKNDKFQIQVFFKKFRIKKVLLFFLIYFLVALDYTIHPLKKCKKNSKKVLTKKLNNGIVYLLAVNNKEG